MESLEKRADESEAKSAKLEARVEAQERHSRQLNLRIYGFKPRLPTGQFENPLPKFRALLTDGLKIPSAATDKIEPSRIHWVAGGAYMIVALSSSAHMSLVKSKRCELSGYKPDGQFISLRDDYTANQQPMVQKVDKIVSALQKKKVMVASAGTQIRYNKRNFPPDHQVIKDLLQENDLSVVDQHTTSTQILSNARASV